MSAYKGFDINTNLTPAPWGAREQQMNQDLIDTVVVDCVSALADTTGHKHKSVYNVDGVLVLDGSSNSSISLNSGTSTVFMSLNSDGTAVFAATTISVPVLCPIEFGGSAYTYVQYDGDNLKLQGRTGIQLDNFSHSQVLMTDASGVVHQGPLETDSSTYVLMPQLIPLQFSSANTSIYGSTAGSNETLTIATDGSSYDIIMQATGNSNQIQVLANDDYSDVRLGAGRDIYLTAASTLYLSGTFQHSGTGAGFMGATPVAAQVIGVAATDAATTLTRVNLIADALLLFGLAVTA
jgi:hypothetical protein